MKYEQFWDEKRIEKVRSWGRYNTYKKGTMAFRILEFLSGRSLAGYKELVENERFNFERNIMNLRRDLKYERNNRYWYNDRTKTSLEDYIESKKWYPHLYPETYEEFIEELKKENEDHELKVQRLKKFFNERVEAGVPFNYTLPGEPGFGQLVATMILDETIEKTFWGIYKITDKGREIYNRKKEVKK